MIRRAEATWDGSVARGAGSIAAASGAFELPYSVASREGDTAETNPEELVGGALAGCYAMSFANLLTRDRHPPRRLRVEATVHLEEESGRFSIPRVELAAQGAVDGIDPGRFQELSREAADCTVARLLAGARISVQATMTAA